MSIPLSTWNKLDKQIKLEYKKKTTNILFSHFNFNWAWQQGIMGYLSMTMVVMEICQGDNVNNLHVVIKTAVEQPMSVCVFFCCFLFCFFLFPF